MQNRVKVNAGLIVNMGSSGQQSIKFCYWDANNVIHERTIVVDVSSEKPTIFEILADDKVIYREQSRGYE